MAIIPRHCHYQRKLCHEKYVTQDTWTFEFSNYRERHKWWCNERKFAKNEKIIVCQAYTTRQAPRFIFNLLIVKVKWWIPIKQQLPRREKKSQSKTWNKTIDWNRREWESVAKTHNAKNWSELFDVRVNMYACVRAWALGVFDVFAIVAIAIAIVALWYHEWLRGFLCNSFQRNSSKRGYVQH